MAGKDRAEDGGTIDVHESHRVSSRWQFAFVYLTDPEGKGQDTITGYGKDEAGGNACTRGQSLSAE